MTELSGKHIVLGVTGSIAAYKAADLVRRLRDDDAEVRVVMTRAACEFITPLTMQSVSGRPVHQDLLNAESEAAMGHIELARWADLLLIAPATAHTLARLAHGFADDLLTAMVLVSSAPVFVAPAMNRQMWQAEVTQSNSRVLQNRGIRVLGPASGEQACGEIGPGRMLEPAQIVALLRQAHSPGILQGLQVLITAGPTREPLDPVRYISNRSSGKMGYAVAAAAAAAGARVTLVSGPVALPVPPGVHRIAVETAADMAAAVLQLASEQHIFIGVAAVADYRGSHPADQKIKKSRAPLQLQLEPTQDILAAVACLPRRPFTVGFAAETQDLLQAAREKLQRKKLDLIAANLVGAAGVGFGSDDNALDLLWAGGHLPLPKAPKQVLAQQLIATIAERYHANHPT